MKTIAPKIFENFLTRSHADELCMFVTDYRFPWYYYPGTVIQDLANIENNYIIRQGINPPQFSHYVNLSNCSYTNLLQPILNTLSTNYAGNLQIKKIKFNLLYKNNDSTHHYPHTDIDDLQTDINTAIYYVNDSDGATYVFNETAPKQSDYATVAYQVYPKKGKMIVFNSNQFHASSSPIKSSIRLVLNIVFKTYSTEIKEECK